MQEVLKVGAESLRQPFLCPVQWPNNDAKPGVTQLVSHSHAHAPIRAQKGLGQEQQARAVTNQQVRAVGKQQAWTNKPAGWNSNNFQQTWAITKDSQPG